jgi:hypothetical protein
MTSPEDKVLELTKLERRAKIPELAIGQWHAQLLEEHSAGDLLGIGNEGLGRILRIVRPMSPEQFRNWLEAQLGDEELEYFEPQDEPGQPIGLLMARPWREGGLL